MPDLDPNDPALREGVYKAKGDPWTYHVLPGNVIEVERDGKRIPVKEDTEPFRAIVRQMKTNILLPEDGMGESTQPDDFEQPEPESEETGEDMSQDAILARAKERAKQGADGERLTTRIAEMTRERRGLGAPKEAQAQSREEGYTPDDPRVKASKSAMERFKDGAKAVGEGIKGAAKRGVEASDLPKKDEEEDDKDEPTSDEGE